MAAKPRDRWPERVETLRQEAKALASDAAQDLRTARQLARQGRIEEANELSAAAEAKNERIARLMAEARNPLS